MMTKYGETQKLVVAYAPHPTPTKKRKKLNKEEHKEITYDTLDS